MRNRTTNPSNEHYKNYGGRGINSDEFAVYIDFYDVMYDSYMELADRIGERNVSLDRINPNGNYTKENCRWIDKHAQVGNQERTLNFIATFPDGHKEKCRNASLFAKVNNLDAKRIGECLRGEKKQHRGFTFEKFIPTETNLLELNQKNIEVFYKIENK